MKTNGPASLEAGPFARAGRLRGRRALSLDQCPYAGPVSLRAAAQVRARQHVFETARGLSTRSVDVHMERSVVGQGDGDFGVELATSVGSDFDDREVLVANDRQRG